MSADVRVREWIANISLLHKERHYHHDRCGCGATTMHVCREKMSWLDMDPASIQHILITHQDTDHACALER